MDYKYKTRGTCAREISFQLEDGIIKNVSFFGGCNGNLKGIAALVEGKKAEEVIPLIKGLKCGFKPTSCPDQLALALTEALNEQNK
ncbi:MAG: TIGR03905 family TSCPD domain-containing protein [Clostridia bacterium]|nr:TIGR03905 family TSCPD domain-containing protein [Clostridia bacterium]